jgi:hypothetical protein
MKRNRGQIPIRGSAYELANHFLPEIVGRQTQPLRETFDNLGRLNTESESENRLPDDSIG